ncbi:hypothetical protein HYZ41_01115 [archaeon]|nr:hypothetical protein [archaeon]
MLFGKKKEQKPLPMDDVKAMTRKGMSDKDIIKDLKHKGYSYKDIEKAMLETVKDGVEPEAVSNNQQSYMPEEFSQQQPQQAFELPTFEEEAPQEMESDQSDLIIEELIEGIVEEKWAKFEDRITKIEDSLEHINAQLKQYGSVLAQPRDTSSKEIEFKVNDITNSLEDLDARVGGLEKAFKQFLPSLTRNIEALSQMIHEIKEKSGRLELEEEA